MQQQQEINIYLQILRKKYTVVNATKMKKHILKCVKCPNYCKKVLQQQASATANVLSSAHSHSFMGNTSLTSSVTGSAVSTSTSAGQSTYENASSRAQVSSSSTCSTFTAVQSSIRSFVDQIDQHEQVRQFIILCVSIYYCFFFYSE